MSYRVPLGYVPISSSALRPLGAAYIPILLFVVTWLKIFKPNDSTKKLSQMVLSQVTGNQGERAYTGYAPHFSS